MNLVISICMVITMMPTAAFAGSTAAEGTQEILFACKMQVTIASMMLDETTQVDYDQIPTAPLNPEKSADDNFTYTFKGWNKELVKAHEDTTYTATFYRTGWLVGEGGRQTITGKQFYFYDFKWNT